MAMLIALLLRNPDATLRGWELGAKSHSEMRMSFANLSIHVWPAEEDIFISKGIIENGRWPDEMNER